MGSICLDNFPLKGIAVENTTGGRIGIEGDPEVLTLDAGSGPVTLDLTLVVPGYEDLLQRDLPVRWELAGGDPACAAVTVAEDGTHAVLTPVSGGKTNLFVYTDVVGCRIIPVEVR